MGFWPISCFRYRRNNQRKSAPVAVSGQQRKENASGRPYSRRQGIIGVGTTQAVDRRKRRQRSPRRAAASTEGSGKASRTQQKRTGKLRPGPLPFDPYFYPLAVTVQFRAICLKEHSGHAFLWGFPSICFNFRLLSSCPKVPDVFLNQIPLDRPITDPEELDEVLSQCYTGQDFIDECSGDVEKAKHLFSYCDWQHPSSAIDELDDDEEEDIDNIAPSSIDGDYSPANPWDAPGMSASDFI